MFSFLKKTLEKTVSAIQSIVPTRKERVPKEQLEELLVACDVNYDIVEEILNELPSEVSREKIFNALNGLFVGLKPLDAVEAKPFVELIIGVNGAGKTTTIAKLAKRYKNSGRSVLLGAGDTFRAAAIEQLKAWADKIDVPIVFTQHGHDPSAVTYDTISSGVARGVDSIIIDTAGRLHNKDNLANELKKIVRVSDKAQSGAPHRKLLILDGTQGSSSINQAKAFDEIVGVNGIIITKLDGTSKGGSIFSIVKELKIPILFIGIGEKEDDLAEFNAQDYINTLLDAIYTEK